MDLIGCRDSRDVSEIPGFDAHHDSVQEEHMEVDNLISSVDETPIATDNDIMANQNHNHIATNAMDILEDHRGESMLLVPSLDLADSIKGYRLLELISEQASNGLGKLSVVVA